jgi:Darcynin, domain of unknown function
MMTSHGHAFKPEFAAFMLVKGAAEWRSLSAAGRRQLAREQLPPILGSHPREVSLRHLDVAVNPTRITDLWIWNATDAQAYGRALQRVRVSRFWNRCFSIVEVLVGVEEAYARHYYRQEVPTWVDPGLIDGEFAVMAQEVA